MAVIATADGVGASRVSMAKATVVEIDYETHTAVLKNPDGTPEGMEWNNILVYAVEEIKKLHKEVEKLKGENTTLHNEIQELRQLISTS